MRKNRENKTMKAIETHALTKYYGKARGIENVEMYSDSERHSCYIL